MDNFEKILFDALLDVMGTVWTEEMDLAPNGSEKPDSEAFFDQKAN